LVLIRVLLQALEGDIPQVFERRPQQRRPGIRARVVALLAAAHSRYLADGRKPIAHCFVISMPLSTV